MVGTSNLCNISPSRQMPSQVTLFSINIKIDCSIDLRTRNICKKSQVILRLSANPSPSWPWTGWRIHEGDFARCTQGSRCIWVYTRVWNKTYCRERLSFGRYGLHVKSRTFITHVYILRLISPFESPWERISIFLQNFATDRKVIDESLLFAWKRYPRKCLFPVHGAIKKKIHSHSTVSSLLDHGKNRQFLQHFAISPNAFSSDPFLHQYKDWL